MVQRTLAISNKQAHGSEIERSLTMCSETGSVAPILTNKQLPIAIYKITYSNLKGVIK